jgi:hypothetical protein
VPQWRKSLLLGFDTDAANRVTIADITLEGMLWHAVNAMGVFLPV